MNYSYIFGLPRVCIALQEAYSLSKRVLVLGEEGKKEKLLRFLVHYVPYFCLLCGLQADALSCFGSLEIHVLDLHGFDNLLEIG